MTIEQISQHFYWYPILWYVIATITAFIAALVFWTKGPAAAEGPITGLPISLKFTGASAIFVVVLLIFHWINPLKTDFANYKTLLIVYSTETNKHVPSSVDVIRYKIDRTTINVDDEDIPWDKDTLHIEMTPVDVTYVLLPQLNEDSFAVKKAIPKGLYTVWFTSAKTGKAKYYGVEVK